MSQRNRFRDAVFWLRFGCFMGMVLGIFLVPASAPGAVALLAASGWVMWSPLPRAAVPLGIALLAFGIALIAGGFEMEDPGASGVWAIGAASLLLGSCVALRGRAAALAGPPSADELREREFEDLLEDIRSSTMTNPNHIQFGYSFLSGYTWRGRLRNADAVLELTTSNDEGRQEREVLIVRKRDFHIDPRGPTLFGKALRAEVRIGRRRITSTISEEALERFTRWKRRR